VIDINKVQEGEIITLSTIDNVGNTKEMRWVARLGRMGKRNDTTRPRVYNVARITNSNGLLFGKRGILLSEISWEKLILRTPTKIEKEFLVTLEAALLVDVI